MKGCTMKTNQEIAREIIAGKWGNGLERRQRLEQAGYNYNDVQSIVNAIMAGRQASPAEPAQDPEPTRNVLEIDYDPESYDGIQVNVLI